jgi:hypothetical protein
VPAQKGDRFVMELHSQPPLTLQFT